VLPFLGHDRAEALLLSGESYLFSAPLDILPRRIKIKGKLKGKGICEASHGFVPVK
jgi:hypothetical protein